MNFFFQKIKRETSMHNSNIFTTQELKMDFMASFLPSHTTLIFYKQWKISLLLPILLRRPFFFCSTIFQVPDNLFLLFYIAAAQLIIHGWHWESAIPATIPFGYLCIDRCSIYMGQFVICNECKFIILLLKAASDKKKFLCFFYIIISHNNNNSNQFHISYI